MANVKGLGTDDLPAKKFKALWPFIRKDFYEVYEEGLVKVSLGTSINQGLIKLIR